METLRQENNWKILELLRAVVLKHPEMRFGQILMVIRALDSENVKKVDGSIEVRPKDIFTEEPDETLKRIIETLVNNQEGI